MFRGLTWWWWWWWWCEIGGAKGHCSLCRRAGGAPFVGGECIRVAGNGNQGTDAKGGSSGRVQARERGVPRRVQHQGLYSSQQPRSSSLLQEVLLVSLTVVEIQQASQPAPVAAIGRTCVMTDTSTGNGRQPTTTTKQLRKLS